MCLATKWTPYHRHVVVVQRVWSCCISRIVVSRAPWIFRHSLWRCGFVVWTPARRPVAIWLSGSRVAPLQVVDSPDIRPLAYCGSMADLFGPSTAKRSLFQKGYVVRGCESFDVETSTAECAKVIGWRGPFQHKRLSRKSGWDTSPRTSFDVETSAVKTIGAR